MIPCELKGYKQWVCWKRIGRQQIKLPISPLTGKSASCTDPSTWGGYDQARATASLLRLDGIGFVFTAGDPYTGVDLDHCCTAPGDLEAHATDLVQRLHSYSEWSPSGKGLHVLVKACLPASGGRRNKGIEIYSSGRYFTMTGDHLEETPCTIEERQEQIIHLLAALDQQSHQRPGFARRLAVVAETDRELIRRACQAKNGAKFRRLWNGDTSDYDGDHSRADAALCSLLAHYTNGDLGRIDRLFRLSGLYRQKWDRPTAGSTYGSITIQAVVRGAT